MLKLSLDNQKTHFEAGLLPLKALGAAGQQRAAAAAGRVRLCWPAGHCVRRTAC